MAKPKAPPPPKEQYIVFERREPSEAQQQMLLEAAIKMGKRPGVAGALINHESAGTWNPEIRPSRPDMPSIKVTTDGKVIGTAGSSGVGLGQWINRRWLLDMYNHGEGIITNGELDKYNPGAVTTIRAVNKLVQAELERTKQKPTWENFSSMVDKLESKPEFKDLMKLRSDKTDRVPMYMLMYNIDDYERDIKAAGLEPNATNVYAVHHSSISELVSLLRKKDYVPADNPKMAAAAAVNGAVFLNADGSAKTGSETYSFYGRVMSDAHATKFEREYYGRDFGTEQDKNTVQNLKGADGQSYAVRSQLVVPRLTADKFLAAWKAPSVAADKPENLAATVTGLQRLGFDFGKTVPVDFNNPRLKAAITSFQHQAGLPHADEGKFDTTTQSFLAQAVSNADKFILSQQTQRNAILKPGVLNLRTIDKETRSIPKDNPLHAEIDSVVIDLKKKLAQEGLLKAPTKIERVKGADGKSRKVETEQPFDGKIDNRVLAALSTYQRTYGLMDSKGIYDAVTFQHIAARHPAAPPAGVAPAAKPALPPSAPDTQRRQSGKVSQADEPYIQTAVYRDPTPQFTLMSDPVSNSTAVLQKVSFMSDTPHIGPYIQSYGNSLKQNSAEQIHRYDERVFEAQRILERMGMGDKLGAKGADGVYYKETDKAFAAYAASKGIDKKPGEVSTELLEAMREDRRALALKDRSPDHFERYLTQFGGPSPDTAPTGKHDRAAAYAPILPRVMQSQNSDTHGKGAGAIYGVTSSSTEFAAVKDILVKRGNIDAKTLAKAEKESPVAVASLMVRGLKEYQVDAGLAGNGRLDLATQSLLELDKAYTNPSYAGVSANFNILGMGTQDTNPIVSTLALSRSLGISPPPLAAAKIEPKPATTVAISKLQT